MSSPLYASANGLRVTTADILIAYYGAPVADIALATPDALASPVSLALGNLTLTMTVVRQVPFAGLTEARLVGGTGTRRAALGGWGREVPAKAYANPAGIKLSTILGDVAREVGETVRLAADATVGLFYVRERGPAQRVLRQLVGEFWYIDAAGVTQVGAARATTTIKTEASVDMYAGGKGWLTVATEDLAAWMPGATYSSATVATPITVSSTRIRSGADGTMRLEVLTT